MTRHTKFGLVATASLAVAVLLTGCSNAASGGSQTADPANVAAGKAAAAKAIAPYVGQPSAFPNLEPLAALPKGANIAFVGQGTPFSAVLYELLQGAAQVMGVRVTQYDAGHAADTINTAFNAILASKPAAVIDAGIDFKLWKTQFAQLKDANIPVVTAGVTGTEAYGIQGPQAAEPYSKLSGSLVADYVTAKLGTNAQVVVYTIPELEFTGASAEAIKSELAKVCPECTMRTVSVPIATIGNSAPSTIVRDLQSHPDSTVGIFPNNEVSTGLSAALSAAGIHFTIVGVAPGPRELQSIKNGDQMVGLALDTPVFAWGLLDQAARLIDGQKLTGYELAGIPVQQFLRTADITFDPSRGWNGYPGFAQRYATIWGVKG